MTASKPDNDKNKTLLTNRAAFFEYHILEKYEAGIVLAGAEVKSIRAGQIGLKDAFVQVRGGEAWLMNAHVSPYKFSHHDDLEPTRARKLLLKKKEIADLAEAVSIKGMTIVVTRLYLKNGRVKLEIGTARGKKLFDKRETEMRRTLERESRAEIKHRVR